MQEKEKSFLRRHPTNGCVLCNPARLFFPDCHLADSSLVVRSFSGLCLAQKTCRTLFVSSQARWVRQEILHQVCLGSRVSPKAKLRHRQFTDPDSEDDRCGSAAQWAGSIPEELGA